MRTAHRLTAAAAVAGAAALGLTGRLPKPTEASSFHPASEVLNESVPALRGASPFTLRGKTMTEGVPTHLNLPISKAGECAGTLSLQTGNAKAIRTRDHVVCHSDEAFARAHTQDLPEEEADQALKSDGGDGEGTQEGQPQTEAQRVRVLLEQGAVCPTGVRFGSHGRHSPVRCRPMTRRPLVLTRHSLT
ncbi:hypothetical protein ACFWUZ_35285 [Streptomyces sp. NPDC058646]|uniref:hypothetical protein n=1 Tax=Streptomyces sp. NPDC058646 TaxID=3346574 RepID=UPI0036499B64